MVLGRQLRTAPRGRTTGLFGPAMLPSGPLAALALTHGQSPNQTISCGLARPEGAEPQSPNLGLVLYPSLQEAQQTSYTKAKSTIGKPCSRFTGRETKVMAT